MGQVKRSLTYEQLSLFGALRHVEMALAREISLLSARERKAVAVDLFNARDLIRAADARLTEIRENRAKRAAKGKPDAKPE